MWHLVDAFAVYAITAYGGRHVILPSFDSSSALATIERERVSCTNVASTMVRKTPGVSKWTIKRGSGVLCPLFSLLLLPSFLPTAGHPHDGPPGRNVV